MYCQDSLIVCEIHLFEIYWPSRPLIRVNQAIYLAYLYSLRKSALELTAAGLWIERYVYSVRRAEKSFVEFSVDLEYQTSKDIIQKKTESKSLEISSIHFEDHQFRARFKLLLQRVSISSEVEETTGKGSFNPSFLSHFHLDATPRRDICNLNT
jgi:hypothetical protein